MARTCRFTAGDRTGAGEWTFDGEQLTLSPADGSPLSVALTEIAGIAGDGYSVDVTLQSEAAVGGGSALATDADAGAVAGSAAAAAAAARAPHMILSHLGPEGPTLLERLQREWLPARAGVLRLSGSGEGKRFYGRVAGLDGGAAHAGAGGTGLGGAGPGGPPLGVPEPFQALLFEDVLLVAREGGDLAPLFVALLGSVEFDEAGYSVMVRQWPGQQIVFSKMAGQTDEFLKALRLNRALLAKESAATLAASVPGLASARRSVLAGMWLPGRLMEVEAMDQLCPGFAVAFRDGWLPRLPRAAEGRYLLERPAAAGASAGGTTSAWLACTRESAEETDEQSLWMLSGVGEAWFLEALSLEDRATYCFKGGADLPALVSRLLCAPQFSREALYSPLVELTGDSAELALPARYLPFLVELRSRFTRRIIHQSPEGWREQVAAKS